MVAATIGRGPLRSFYGRQVGSLRLTAQACRFKRQLRLYKPIPATRKSDGGEAEFVFDLTSAPTSPITMEILASDGEVISKSEWRDARS